MAEQNAVSTKVVTGKVRLSYANVWEPRENDQGQMKYSCSLIIPKDDTKTINAIKAAVKVAAEAGKSKIGDKNGKIPTNVKIPLRDGDLDRADDPVYANCYFINANSNQAPGIVDRNCKPILDQSEVYSGCYVRAEVNFFAFSTSGNKGVGCGLNHIQKWCDGEPLSSRGRAENAFGAIEDDGDDAEAMFL